jgi:zinc transport system substrate-binding protein
MKGLNSMFPTRHHVNLSALVVTFLLAGSAGAANVVATIKPIHSLVSAVMAGAGEPHLIVRGPRSPHTYNLRPSDAAALRDAAVVFWVGPNLEVFLAAPLKTIADSAKIVALGSAPGVQHLPMRERGSFEAHDHDEFEAHGHDEETPNEHARSAVDPHTWLDPLNAKAMLRAIAGALVTIDPDNADIYRANENTMARRLDVLVADVDAQLSNVRGRPFIVFHDAYHYFERRFRIEAAASITIKADIMPGARRLVDIRNKILTLGPTCVFSERQFDPRLVQVVTEGVYAGRGILDPLGTALNEGPDLYEMLIRDMAATLKECLASIR